MSTADDVTYLISVLKLAADRGNDDLAECATMHELDTEQLGSTTANRALSAVEQVRAHLGDPQIADAPPHTQDAFVATHVGRALADLGLPCAGLLYAWALVFVLS